MNTKFYVEVSFSVKEQAKPLNAKFNNDKKSWYFYTNFDNENINILVNKKNELMKNQR
jgi:hypothetical protein